MRGSNATHEFIAIYCCVDLDLDLDLLCWVKKKLQLIDHAAVMTKIGGFLFWTSDYCFWALYKYSATTTTITCMFICWYSTLWTIKRAPFLFLQYGNLIKCWPNFTIFARIVAEKICNIFVLCCSPHLFSVVTLPQEIKVPFNYACTCESVPLYKKNSSHDVNDKNVQAEQNHSNSQCYIYVSAITWVRSVRLRQIHNSEGWSSDWLKRGLQCHSA